MKSIGRKAFYLVNVTNYRVLNLEPRKKFEPRETPAGHLEFLSSARIKVAEMLVNTKPNDPITERCGK